MRKKKRIRTIIIIALICVCVFGYSFYSMQQNKKENTTQYIYKASQVEKGDIVLGIEESGTVEMAETELDYNLDLDTDEDSDDSSDSDDEDESTRYLKVEDVYVSQGQTIAEGDKLFKLTDTSVNSVRRLLRANQSEAQITLTEAEQDYETGKLEASGTKNESDTAAADASSVYQAQLDELQATIDGYNGDIEALSSEIEDLQEQVTDEDLLDSLSDAKLEMESASSVLADTDTGNFGAYTANQSDYQTAKDAYDTIVDQIDKLNDQIDEDSDQIDSDQKLLAQAQAALKEKQTEADNTYKSSTLTGQVSGKVYSYSVASLKEAVTEAQATLDDAQSQYDEFNEFVGDDGIIYADGSGVITAINYEAGDSIESTGALLTYTQSDAYTISIDVSEEDISAITIGDSVDITFSAYDDLDYKGTVNAISTTSSDDHASTVSYSVTIGIEGDTTPLYGGMTANVTFTSDSVTGVLYVSEQSIVTKDDNTYVYMKKDDGSAASEADSSDTSSGDYELVQIETGFSNGSNIEVKSGLSEGDTVYIQSKVSSDEEQLKDTSSSDSGQSDSSLTGASGQSSGGTSGNMPSGNMPSGDMPSGNMPDMMQQQ